MVLNLCRELGIVINPQKSNLEPSQVVQYLGVVIDAQTFVASSPERIARLLSTAGEFLSSADPPASIWLSLLGMLPSISHLVPGGRPTCVPPATMPPPVLGSGGSVNPDSLVSELSSESAVVAPIAPPFSGGVSVKCLPT